MESQIILIALLLFVLLSLIGFLLFKRKAKVGFTIAKLFKFNFEGSNETDLHLPEPLNKSSLNTPVLILKLIDGNGQYQDELFFTQIASNQDFYFGLALINATEDSIPAEKLDIRVEASWDGGEIIKAPKFRTDAHNRTTPGWAATRPQVQQSDIPLPAILSFHGTSDTRSSFGHPVEWHRFSVVLADKTTGIFILNYVISSAIPRTTNKGKCYIRISSI